jgi:hypothetical protein
MGRPKGSRNQIRTPISREWPVAASTKSPEKVCETPQEGLIPLRTLRMRASLAGARLSPFMTREETWRAAEAVGGDPGAAAPIQYLSFTDDKYETLAKTPFGMALAMDINGRFMLTVPGENPLCLYDLDSFIDVLTRFREIADERLGKLLAHHRKEKADREAELERAKDFSGEPKPLTADQQRIMDYAVVLGLRNGNYPAALVHVAHAYGISVMSDMETINEITGQPFKIPVPEAELMVHVLKAMETPL